MGLFSERKHVEFEVPDMNCSHCEAKVSTAVQGLPGVKKVRATSANKRLVIEYRNDLTPTLESVNGVLEPAGYVAKEVG